MEILQNYKIFGMSQILNNQYYEMYVYIVKCQIYIHFH